MLLDKQYCHTSDSDFATIIELLPYSPEKLILNELDLKKLINLTLFFYGEMNCMIKIVLDEEFHKLDAQVGENLCQVRAVNLLFILKHTKELSIDKETLMLNFEKISTLINQLKQVTQSSISVKNNLRTKAGDFLDKEGLLIELPKIYILLFKMHILHKYCVLDTNNIPITINTQKISETAGIVNSAAKRLIHNFQKSIAKHSTEFTIDCFSFSSQLKNDALRLKKLCRYADEKRWVFPCFIGAKALMSYLAKFNFPICVVIKHLIKESIFESKILFEVDANKTYQITHSPETHLDSSAMIIEGISSNLSNPENTKKIIIQKGIEEILYLNMAAHPQYTGKVLKNFSINPYMDIEDSDDLHDELSEYQYRANILGCSLENPSLFFIKHIFVSKLDKIFKEASKLGFSDIALKNNYHVYSS